MDEILYGKEDSRSRRSEGRAVGLGAWAEDGPAQSIDLNEQLILNKAASFFMRMRGDAMCDAGIADGDLLVADRSMKAISGRIVVAMLNGELLVRRLEKTFNKVRLLADNNRVAAIDIDGNCEEFTIRAVVTYCIHQV